METEIEDKFYLHWLNLLPQMGPKRLWQLKRYFGSFAAAAAGGKGGFAAAGLAPKIAYAAAEHCGVPDLTKKIIMEKGKLAALDISIVIYDDPEFPPPLREIATPPLLLYCRGDLSKIKNRICVAIVGTRRPTAYGLAATEKFTAGLAAAGVVVVSGLAFGIDIAAHRSALKNGGRTIAVVPSGADELSIYPQSHSRVANAIARAGCVISECPPGSETLPYCFLARNRIIAGLCRGTVIIECAERSGALITASCARDENRTVYAVPGSIYNPMSRGPNALLGQGAIPVSSAEDILKDLNLLGAAAEAKRENLTPEEKQVLQYINSVPIGADAIVKSMATGSIRLNYSQVIAALAILELKGIIIEYEPEQYCLIDN